MTLIMAFVWCSLVTYATWNVYFTKTENQTAFPCTLVILNAWYSTWYDKVKERKTEESGKPLPQSRRKEKN